MVGETITVLASNAATQGYEIFLQQGDEGTGPPPHFHDWDESFYVVKGNVEISYGDKTMVCGGSLHSSSPASTRRFRPGHPISRN